MFQCHVRMAEGTSRRYHAGQTGIRKAGSMPGVGSYQQAERGQGGCRFHEAVGGVGGIQPVRSSYRDQHGDGKGSEGTAQGVGTSPGQPEHQHRRPAEGNGYGGQGDRQSNRAIGGAKAIAEGRQATGCGGTEGDPTSDHVDTEGGGIGRQGSPVWQSRREPLGRERKQADGIGGNFGLHRATDIVKDAASPPRGVEGCRSGRKGSGFERSRVEPKTG